ncbi:hypothetical protein ACQY0O_003961 [Thecaphora frezii]
MPQLQRSGVPPFPRRSREPAEAQQVPRSSYHFDHRPAHYALLHDVPTRWPRAAEMDHDEVHGQTYLHHGPRMNDSVAAQAPGFSSPQPAYADDGSSASRRRSDPEDSVLGWSDCELAPSRSYLPREELQRRHSIARRRTEVDSLADVETHAYTSSAFARNAGYGLSTVGGAAPHALARRYNEAEVIATLQPPQPQHLPHVHDPLSFRSGSGSLGASPYSSAAAHPRLKDGGLPVPHVHSRHPPTTLASPPLAPSSSLASSSLPAQPLAAAPSDPPRARVACTFCRARKLRCDGVSPCRHCERRSIQCVYTAAKAKPKASNPPPHLPLSCAAGNAGDGTYGLRDQIGHGASGSSRPLDSAGPGHGRIDDRAAKRSGHNHAAMQLAGSKRKFQNNDGAACPPYEQQPQRSFDSQDRIGADNDQRREGDAEGAVVLRRTDPHFSSRPKHSHRYSSTDVSSGSDLAKIQNDDSPIPMQPAVSFPETWYDHAVAAIGGSRPFGSKLIQLLLRRFVQSNAIFFGLLHAPTLLRTVSTRDDIRRANPALYLSVMAVAVCDLHRTQMSEPLTADLQAADAASKQLSLKLVSMAQQYLDAAMLSQDGPSLSTGQAASILALLYPDGSSEQASLIQVAENTVRISRMYEVVSSREPEVQPCGPDSPLYWRRPIASESSDAEIHYESIVRLCWTGLSHRCRRVIAFPDLDIGGDRWPEFLEAVRPMAFWEPSILPPELPATFFHSQSLMRCSAEVARVCIALATNIRSNCIDADDALAPENTPPPLPPLVSTLLHRLDKLEAAFVRHRPANAAEMYSILGRTCQMFCRMHVWVRLSIWRKYGFWSEDNWRSMLPAHDQLQTLARLSPSLEFWIVLYEDMITTIAKDLDSFVVAGTLPQSSLAEIDSLIRHCTCALDLVEATRQPDAFLPVFDRAVATLKRVESVSKFNSHFPQLDEAMLGRMTEVRTRRGGFDWGSHRSVHGKKNDLPLLPCSGELMLQDERLTTNRYSLSSSASAPSLPSPRSELSRHPSHQSLDEAASVTTRDSASATGMAGKT